jgi:hypothetical protein
MKSYIKKDKKNSLFFVIAFSISVLVTSIVLTLFVRFNNNPTPIISKQILEKKEVDTRINLFSYIMHKTNNDRAKALAAVKSLDNDYSEFIADYKNNSDDSGTLKLRNPDGSDSGQTADYYETLYGFLVNKESAYGMAYSDLNYLKMNLEERTKQKISNDEQQNLEYTTKIENYLRDIENYEDRNFVTDDLSTNILLSGNNEYDKTRAVAQWFNAHVDRLNVKSFDS